MAQENRSWGYDRLAGALRVPLPPQSPNLNAYAERWVRSVKEECLSRHILFGEASLRHALAQYVAHFRHERHHQGKGNVLLFPGVSQDTRREGPIQCCMSFLTLRELQGHVVFQLNPDQVHGCSRLSGETSAGCHHVSVPCPRGADR
jgi:Integrase core domain